MAHQHRVRPGLNAGTERHKVRLLKCFIAACIARNACVRVGITSIAGEMFQHAGHSLPVHGLHYLPYIFCCLLRPLAEGTWVNKIFFICAHIAHRCKVHIDAQILQKSALVQRVGPHGRQPARLE